MKYFFFLFTLVFAFYSVSAAGPIDQVGYMKDNKKNRIFTLTYHNDVTEKEIQAHAEKLMNTGGRLTAAYYFPAGSHAPGDRISVAEDMHQANTILYDAPGYAKWTYSYMKRYNGSAQFINCINTPENILCR